MPLTKAKGNMYPWVTHTHTHLAGECPHKCRYCYVQAIEQRFGTGRYMGELRFVDDELDVRYGMDRTIFVEHCNDLWAEAVPAEWIMCVLRHCNEWPQNEYVFQSKNPGRFTKWLHQMPTHRLLGCTIETTDEEIAAAVSDAPPPWQRRHDIGYLRSLQHERVFVTIEPILDGDMQLLAEWLSLIAPEFVNIGADSKATDLPEPPAEKVLELITGLKAAGIEIRRKRNLGRLLPDLKGV